jgi:hypothetical protein
MDDSVGLGNLVNYLETNSTSVNFLLSGPTCAKQQRPFPHQPESTFGLFLEYGILLLAHDRGGLFKDDAMKIRRAGAAFGVMLLIAACGATQENLTTTRFVTPSPTGAINIGLQDATSRVYTTSTDSRSGFAFQTGQIENEGLFAVAGLLPGSTVTAAPSSSANYTGTYNLVAISGIALTDDSIYGFRREESGSLTLQANFANGSVVSAPGSALSVNGTANGRDLSGTVSYNGISGALDGLIGGDRAIGAFHGEGNDDTYMYAGGFIANRSN